MKTFGKLLSLFFFISVLSSVAQTTDDAVRITADQLGFGARALGMGGAYTGVADDYSAVYWNPAGLAQMRKMEFWMGISHVKFDNDITYRGVPSTAANNATKFNSIGMVFPVPTYRGSLVFALGYQKLRDFEYANNFRGISPLGTDQLSFYLDSTSTLYNFWGKDVQKEEYVSDGGSVNQWSAAVAVDVSPNVSVGATLNYWTGSSDYQQDFNQNDIYNLFTQYPANFNDYIEKRQLITKYSSFSLKLGGMFHAGRLARVGLSVDLPHSFNVRETYHDQSSIGFDDGEIIDFDPVDGEFEYDVKTPFRFSGGVSIALGPAMLSGSADYTDWTQLEFKLPSNADLNSDYSDLLDQNQYFKQNYRETVRFRLGGEAGIPLFDSQVRAGYIYDPNPLKNSLSENNRKYYTVGYGVLIDRVLKLDLTYIRGNWKQTTFDDLAPAGTAEDILFQKFLVTLAYRF